MSAPEFASLMSHSSRYTTDAFDLPVVDDAGETRSAESALRKRPKYTRSKTGCLTCRGKKIKCDEMKPSCSRCAHAQRECKWPDGVMAIAAARKRSSPKTNTTDSPFPSSSGTPPATREHSPQKFDHGHGHSLHVHIPDIPEPMRYSPPYARRESHRSPLSASLSRSSQSDVYYSPSPTSVSSPRIAYPLSADVRYSTHHGTSLLSTLESPFVPAGAQHMHSNSLNTSPVDTHFSGTYSANSSQSSGRSPEVSWSGPVLQPSSEPFYSSARERPLMQHFADMSNSLLAASPTVDGTNPILALHMPLIKANLVAISAVEAHKYALLSLAAIHNAFLHHVHQLTSNAAAEAWGEANAMRIEADRHLEAAMASSNDVLNDSTLAAVVMLILTDIFAGNGKDWDEHLAMGKSVIATRGGPALVAAGPVLKMTSQWGGGLVFCPGRVLLDYLAVFEVFGSLITGEEPTLLSGNDAWWYSHELHGPFTEPASYHAISIEHIFGFSRAFVPLLAKAFALLLRASLVQEPLSEYSSSPPGAADHLSIWDDAQALNAEVANWHITLPAPEQRVWNGNRVHQLALQILILRDVFQVHHTDGRIQNWTECIVAIVQECIAAHACVGLLWPMTVASCQALPHIRDRVREIFDDFRAVSCFQVDMAEKLVIEVWRRLDTAHPRPHWRHVLEDFHLKVLFI